MRSNPYQIQPLSDPAADPEDPSGFNRAGNSAFHPKIMERGLKAPPVPPRPRAGIAIKTELFQGLELDDPKDEAATASPGTQNPG